MIKKNKIDLALRYSFIISFYTFSVPFFNIFINSQAATLFPIYTKEISLILFSIFFILPIILVFIFFKILDIAKLDLQKIFIFIFILVFLKNFDYYISYKLNYLNNLLIIRYIIIISISYILVKNFNKITLDKFTSKIFPITQIAFLIISTFYFLMYFNHFYKKDLSSDINNSSDISEIKDEDKDQFKNIIIITFEKLPKILLLDENDELSSKFENLSKINFINFKNFKSTGIQTRWGLKNLYTGTFSNKAVNKDEDNEKSIFRYLNNLNYQIFFINDYINYPCQSIYVNCIKSIKDNNNKFQTNLFVSNWFFNFVKIYIPRSFFQRINFDILDNVQFNKLHSNSKETYSKQFKEMENILKLKTIKNKAIIIHSFLTDGSMDYIQNYKH